MRSISIRALCLSALAASLTGVLVAQAVAQGAPIEFRVTPTDRNPSACQQFDAALSLLVLNFISQPEKAAREMKRVTKPGGVLAAAVWDFKFLLPGGGG